VTHAHCEIFNAMTVGKGLCLRVQFYLAPAFRRPPNLDGPPIHTLIQTGPERLDGRFLCRKTGGEALRSSRGIFLAISDFVDSEQRASVPTPESINGVSDIADTDQVDTKNKTHVKRVGEEHAWVVAHEIGPWAQAA
jgi:hypothetical protein